MSQGDGACGAVINTCSPAGDEEWPEVCRLPHLRRKGQVDGKVEGDGGREEEEEGMKGRSKCRYRCRLCSLVCSSYKGDNSSGNDIVMVIVTVAVMVWT